MSRNRRIGRLPRPDDIVERAKSGDVDDSMNEISLLDLEDWELELHVSRRSTPTSVAAQAGRGGDEDGELNGDCRHMHEDEDDGRSREHAATGAPTPGAASLTLEDRNG
jgi:hypothetical protein